MLFPTDAYELVTASPFIAGTSPNDANNPGLLKIRSFYDLPESEWAKVAPPFVVWVPSRDSFDDKQPQQVRVTRRGREEAIEAVGRCVAGHDIHLFVARTADIAARRNLFSLLTRFLLACRYALNTTANFRIGDGRPEQNRTLYPNMLHYVLSLSVYVPIVDVPDVLAAVDTVVIQSSRPYAIDD